MVIHDVILQEDHVLVCLADLPGQLQVFGLKLAAVRAPGCVELDHHVLGQVAVQLLEALGDADLDRTGVAGWDGLRPGRGKGTQLTWTTDVSWPMDIRIPANSWWTPHLPMQQFDTVLVFVEGERERGGGGCLTHYLPTVYIVDNTNKST